MSQRELICREKAALREKQGNPKPQSGPQTDSVQTFRRLQWIQITVEIESQGN